MILHEFPDLQWLKDQNIHTIILSNYLTVKIEEQLERLKIRKFFDHVNGHDDGTLRKALHRIPLAAGRPTAIICHTVKGKGLPAAESNADWHHKNKLTDSELDAIRVAVGDF